MKARSRSISGAVTAVLVIPFIVGLLACIPVPIGDPEKSRIDDDFTGIWMSVETEDLPNIVLFEPYDKRTWLVTLYEFDVDDQDCDSEFDEPETFEEIMALVRELGKSCLQTVGQQSYKAWAKELGDAEFMTWEHKGRFHAEYAFEPEFWLGFKIVESDQDEFRLLMMDIDDGIFGYLEDNKSLDKLDEEGRPRNPRTLRSARRAFERVLRRHGDILEEVDREPVRFHRIQPEDYDLFLDSIVPAADETEWIP